MPGPFFAVRTRGRVQDVQAALKVMAKASQRFDAFLQLADVDAVFDAAHAESAYLHAQRALDEGRASSTHLGGEFLRFLTAERQVGRAIKAGGVKAGQEACALVAAGPQAGAAVWWILDQLGWSRDPEGLKPNVDALDRLGVTAAERAAVPEARWGDLVLERVALVDLERA